MAVGTSAHRAIVLASGLWSVVGGQWTVVENATPPPDHWPLTTRHCPYNQRMNPEWRLIVSPPASGAANMALDEALLEGVTAGTSPPTLRLYGWKPPCLSLGHAQPLEVVDLAALHSEGWDLIRRPTGGRALLHADEVTYAVAAPADHPALAGGVLEGYRTLSQGLLAALEILGITPDRPQAAPISPEDRANPVCFEVASAYEITVSGRKLIGSAQLRRRGAVLQHGSLPLEGDITRVVRVLRFVDEGERQQAAHRLRRHATTLAAEAGRRVPWEEAADALALGFTRGLGLHLRPGVLEPGEIERAAVLEAGRSSPDARSTLRAAGAV